MPDQAVLHITASLQKKSGLPRDVVMNTWTFVNGAGFSADKNDDALECFNRLTSFYDNIDGVAIAQNIQGSGGLLLEAFDISEHLDGSAAGPPFSSLTHNITPEGTGLPLPNEVAIAITWHADMSSTSEFGPSGTRPRARLRSRVYIGPLTVLALAASPTVTEPIVSSSLITNLRTQAIAMMVPTTSGWTLGVWSRVDEAVRVAVGGWIDNAFDSQRRRGNDATSRSTF